MFQVASTRRCPSRACFAGGIALFALAVLGGPAPALAASPDGRDLASGGRVEKIAVRETAVGTEVSIRCDREVGQPTVPFTLREPPRLVLELAGFHHDEPNNNLPVGNELLDAVRLGNYTDRVRVVLVSPRDPFPEYDMKVAGRDIVLTVFGTAERAATDATPSAPEANVPDRADGPPPTSLDPTRNQITGIRLEPQGSGARLEIQGEKDLDCDVFELSERTLALSLENTVLPEGMRGRIQPPQGGAGVEYVDAYPSMDPQQRDARVIVELTGDLPYRVIRGGKSLAVDVSPAKPETTVSGGAVVAAAAATGPKGAVPSEDLRAEPAAVAPPKLMEIGGAAEAAPAAPAEAPFTPLASAPAPSAAATPAPAEAPGTLPPPPAPTTQAQPGMFLLPQSAGEQKEETPIAAAGAAFRTGFFEPQTKFTGTKISIDVQDAEIQNILRLIADISGLNMIISENVTGRITIKLKNIPWDQALDIILKTKGLGQEREGSIVRIAPYEQLEKEQERKISERRRRDVLDPVILKIIPVNFASSADLLPKLQQIASKRDDVSIDTDTRTNSLIIKDTEKIVSIMADLVRSLDTPTPQVLIEARIVEANINFSRQYGIQWGTGYVQSPETGNATGMYFPNSWSVAGFPTGTGGEGTLTSLVNGPSGNPLLVNLPAAVGGTGAAVGLTLASIDDTLTLDIIISALEDTGQGKLISSPRVITIDNKQARIEQGFDIPFRTVSLEGAEVSFQSANLELSVTPHITPDESIVMKISVSNDSPDFSQTVEGNPLVSRKSAETEVLIRNGETAIIGGIFTVDTKFNRNAVPWFGDIPVLGLLFRRDIELNDKKELVVFITPTIIKRASR